MCQTPSLVINNLIWRSPTLEDATALKLSQPLYKGCPVLYAMEGSPQITCATHGYVTLEYVQGIYSMYKKKKQNIAAYGEDFLLQCQALISIHGCDDRVSRIQKTPL